MTITKYATDSGKETVFVHIAESVSLSMEALDVKAAKKKNRSEERLQSARLALKTKMFIETTATENCMG